MRRPEIVDLAVAQMLNCESGSGKTLRDDALAAGVIGSDRRSADQVGREVENGCHRTPKRRLVRGCTPVIPAKAGIQLRAHKKKLDPGLRRADGSESIASLTRTA